MVFDSWRAPQRFIRIQQGQWAATTLLTLHAYFCARSALRSWSKHPIELSLAALLATGYLATRNPIEDFENIRNSIQSTDLSPYALGRGARNIVLEFTEGVIGYVYIPTAEEVKGSLENAAYEAGRWSVDIEKAYEQGREDASP